MISNLFIVFILLTSNQVSWLTTDFVHSKIICQQNEMFYITEKDGLWTFHTFELPKGNWECGLISWKGNHSVSKVLSK
jgi:hypothetical protein